MLFICVGVGILLAARSRLLAEPERDRSGRYVLAPKNSITGKRRVGLLFLALWWGVGIAALGHFLWVSGGVMDTESLVIGPIYFGLGLIPLGAVLYWTRLLGIVGDAVVTVDQADYRPGDEILVELDQPVNQGLYLNHVEVSLIGEQTTNPTPVRT